MKVKQERKLPLSGVYLGAPDSPPHYFGVPCRSAKTARISALLKSGLVFTGPSVIEALSRRSYTATVFIKQLRRPCSKCPPRPIHWIISVYHASHHGAAAQWHHHTGAVLRREPTLRARRVVLSFYFAMTGTSFGAGWLADRWGVRRTISQGHLFLGICTVAAALSPSFVWACASFFLAGLGYSFSIPLPASG
jgi:hypothetical protein